MTASHGSPRVFELLADAYRARPGYPDALADRLSELTGEGRTIVDLGAGTGLLAAPLARRGHPVQAVEPAAAMLAVCAEQCAGLSVTPVLAPAESTGLGEIDAGLILLADSVQWVRPDAAGAEARRLLAPDGVAAVVAPEPVDTPFMRGLRVLLVAANPKARSLSTGARTRQFLALAAGSGRPREETWEQRIHLAPETLRGVVRSLSYGGPALGPARTERLLDEVEALGEREGREWARVLKLSWLRRGRRSRRTRTHPPRR
ncbi:MAG TPA: class I SAM-dependent methyltransferase [Myxococcaceae bacterium]|nr:class I SAM-dependent methyltransferase [Myxococcaceae bacterium]